MASLENPVAAQGALAVVDAAKTLGLAPLSVERREHLGGVRAAWTAAGVL